MVECNSYNHFVPHRWPFKMEVFLMYSVLYKYKIYYSYFKYIFFINNFNHFSMFDTYMKYFVVYFIAEKSLHLTGVFNFHTPLLYMYLWNVRNFLNDNGCLVGWGCRIHWLHLCKGVRSPPNECPGYDTKQSDGEVPVMLEFWGIQSTPSLPSLQGPL